MTSQTSSRELAQLAFKYRAAASVTDSSINDFLSALDTPRSLAVWLLYNNQEHEQLVDLGVDPLHYEDGARFRDDYIATEFLSKSNFLKLDRKRDEVAMAKFFEFEELCRTTNDRFRSPLSDAFNSHQNASLLNATRQKIERILGDYSPDEFVDCANWGPGVSTLIKGECVSGYNKFQSETGITRDLYSFIKPWFASAYPSWAEHLRSSGNLDTEEGFTFERGNVIVTVPKNAKTDRVIAIEPGINLWFQKSIGTMIRRRMARFGVDLNHQDRNQQFAHEGAFLGHLATVDFRSASDSISSAVVRDLIPPRWLALMEATRSVVGINGKQVIRWNKFSSMGNGFTWELESLIFYAAALAVCESHRVAISDVGVYGDDVIIPAQLFSAYSEFCAFLGFLVNPKKSYASGMFRESCGAHYFGALDCKPLYLKDKITNVQTIYKLANGVRLLAHRIGNNRCCDARFLHTHTRLYNRVPSRLRLKIPAGLGDVGFICNFDEARPALPRGRQETWEGYLARGLFESGVTRDCDGFGLILDRSRGSSMLEQGNTHALRGRTKLVLRTSLVHKWYNLGSWA